MRFYVVKIWTSHRNYTGFTIAYRNTFLALLQHNTCHCRAAQPLLRDPVLTAASCFQASNMTCGSTHIKTILNLQSPAPRPSPAIFLLMLQGISFVMIHTQSRFQERRPWRRLGSPELRVYMLLKNRLVL